MNFYQRLKTLLTETAKPGSGYTFSLIYHERQGMAHNLNGGFAAWHAKVIPDQPNPYKTNYAYLKAKFTKEQRIDLAQRRKARIATIRAARLTGLRTHLSKVQAALPKGSERGPAYKVGIADGVFDTRQLVPFLRGLSDCLVRVGTMTIERDGEVCNVFFVQRKTWFVITTGFAGPGGNGKGTAEQGSYATVKAWLRGKRALPDIPSMPPLPLKP